MYEAHDYNAPVTGRPPRKLELDEHPLVGRRVVLWDDADGGFEGEVKHIDDSGVVVIREHDEIARLWSEIKGIDLSDGGRTL